MIENKFCKKKLMVLCSANQKILKFKFQNSEVLNHRTFHSKNLCNLVLRGLNRKFAFKSQKKKNCVFLIRSSIVKDRLFADNQGTF